MLRKSAVLLAVLLALLIGLHLVFRLPPLEGRTASAAVLASAGTPLGRLGWRWRDPRASAAWCR